MSRVHFWCPQFYETHLKNIGASAPSLCMGFRTGDNELGSLLSIEWQLSTGLFNGEVDDPGTCMGTEVTEGGVTPPAEDGGQLSTK